MDVREYLRDELLEEAELGFMDNEELQRRLALFDSYSTTPASSVAVVKAQVSGTSSPLSVPKGDPSITEKDQTIETPAGRLDVYIVRPKGEETLPGVIVIHENQGLVPHIRDVARRVAKLGYVVLAPDLLTAAGGVDKFADAAERSAALGTIERDVMVTQLVAAYGELASLDGVDGERIGAIGFCFGGGMTWMLAVSEPRLKAAVPFYGPIPPLDLVPNIGAAVLGIYGAEDERITGMVPDIESAMVAAGKSFEREIYEGAGHAFYNDDKPDRYSPEASASAWKRTADFLAKHLGK